MTSTTRPAFYFDLSELFFASSARLPYYGIARAVREVARALSALEVGARFVVYSPAHRRFFEPSVQPKGNHDFVFPRALQPRQIRHGSLGQNSIEGLLRSVATSLANTTNRVRWTLSNARNWSPVDMENHKLVSFARPKILSSFFLHGNTAAQFYPMLHDLIPLHELLASGGPKFARNFLHDTQVTARHATRLIANSHFTSREIQDFVRRGYLGENCPPVSTVQLAHELMAPTPHQKKTSSQSPFFLCVGTQTGRKNVEVVLKALLYLHQQGRSTPRIVLAGAKRKRTVAILDSPEFAPISTCVEFRVNPNDSELAALYVGSEALIIPSKIEGWGLPLGEALWAGTPAIAADTPALREVGGETAQYFDPDNPIELAEVMDKFKIPQFKAKLKLIVRDAKPSLRTWTDVAREITDVVR